MNITKLWAAQLDDYVIDLSWSPDGRILASASAAGAISLFDGRTGAKLHELAGHAEGTNSVAFAPAVVRGVDPGLPADASAKADPASARQAAILASGGQDGKVRFWDALIGCQTSEMESGPGAWVERVQWRPIAPNSRAHVPNSNLLAAAAGRKLLLMNTDGAIAHVFPDAPKTLSALAWHPRGGAIAAAYFGGVVLWDANDYQVQRQFAYGGAIETLVWSPDGRWLVAGAQDKAVHLWIPDEDQEFHMSGYETKVREVSFSADSRWLATGGARDACVWDCSGAGPEGREPLALPHPDRVCAVAFQQAHGLLATAANDGDVGLWSITHGGSRVATVKLTAPASNLVWSPDDTLLAIGSQKGGVLVLQVQG